jgi:flagellar motor switch/type III secretory pathway protein FliN
MNLVAAASPLSGLATFDATGSAGIAGARGGRPLEERHWRLCGQLPMQLMVTIPLPQLSLRELLVLRKGQLLLSSWSAREDVPLLVGDTFLANVTFEAAGAHLGVRISNFQRKPSGQPASGQPSPGKATGPLSEEPDAEHALNDIRLPASLLFGTNTMRLQEILGLTSGDAIVLERAVNAPVSVLAGRRIVAQGELVAVKGFYGVRLAALAELSKRLPGARSEI